MPRVLILFAHPVLERSRVNRRLVDAVSGLEGVTVNDLYERYPALDIDVAREQRLLSEHDVVIMQHPFYWYSSPAILKEWQDLVLEHGWAYGRDGHALVGKVMVSAVTTGGPALAYRTDGANRFTMRTLLSPFDQTAHLCGMRYLAPFVLHGTLRHDTAADVAPLARSYRRLVEALRDGRLDLDRAAAATNLHDELDGLLLPESSAARSSGAPAGVTP